MANEIERKFIVSKENFEKLDFEDSFEIKQGYIQNEKEKSIRIRIKNKKAFITIKGKTIGLTKPEFEYEIPYEDGIEMLNLFSNGQFIEKTRFIKKINNKVWEIDVFDGNNSGLIIAEIELSNENEEIVIPDWCGEEVSTDEKYINAKLLTNPYINWK